MWTVVNITSDVWLDTQWYIILCVSLCVCLSVCVSVWYCGWCWPVSVRHACSLSVCLCVSLSVRLSLSCIVDVICIWSVTCRCLACYYVYSAVTTCPYIRLSTVSATWRYAKVKVTQIQKLQKCPISKLSPLSACVQSKMLKRWIVLLQDNISILSRHIFDICPHLASRDLQTSAILESSSGDISGTCGLTLCLILGYSFWGWRINWIYLQLHQIQRCHQPPSLTFQMTVSLEQVVWSTSVFRSRVGFSGSTVWMALFLVRSNPICRPWLGLTSTRALQCHLLPNYFSPCICHVTLKSWDVDHHSHPSVNPSIQRRTPTSKQASKQGHLNSSQVCSAKFYFMSLGSLTVLRLLCVAC